MIPVTAILRMPLALLLLAVPAAAEVVTVRQVGFYFSPREVVIHPGDTVRWEWTSGTHTVTEGTDGLLNGNELFHSALTSGTPFFEWTFSAAFLGAHPMPGGRYEYFCLPHFHIGMTATVVVSDPVPGSVICAGDGSGTACPCGNAASAPVGCLNSTGQGSRLRATGSADVTADTLELRVTGASEGSSVLFFQGSSAVNGGAGVVFGDGLRCAGGAVVRLGQTSVSFGWARYPAPGDVPISVRGQVPPGATRHYQVWHRDAPSVCTGGVSTNFSNAYSVTWQ
jgi:plastocyanin